MKADWLLSLLAVFLLSGVSRGALICLDSKPADDSVFDDGLTADQKIRIQRLTSIFENGNPNFDYGYIDELHDGRGYTAGRVGFCTAKGCGDLFQVVALYVQKKPGNLLEKYLPELKTLAESDETGSIKDLKGFVNDWKSAAKDPVLRQAQDQCVDRIYMLPALKAALQSQIHLPMGKAIFYDTLVMHGMGNDPDGLPALQRRADMVFCTLFPETQPVCKPRTESEEIAWLKEFLKVRKDDLLNPSDASTKKEWSQNAVRVDDLKDLLEKLKGQLPAATEKIKTHYYTGPF